MDKTKDLFWFKQVLTLAQNPLGYYQAHKNAIQKSKSYCHIARERGPGKKSCKNRIQSKILSQNKQRKRKGQGRVSGIFKEFGVVGTESQTLKIPLPNLLELALKSRVTTPMSIKEHTMLTKLRIPFSFDTVAYTSLML